MVRDREWLDFDCKMWCCLVAMGRCDRNGQVWRRSNGLKSSQQNKLEEQIERYRY